MTLVVGVDHCKGHWLCVARRLPRTEFVAEVRDLRGVFELARLADVVAIDLPIGLPDRDERACDLAARSVLGTERAACLIAVPPRVTLEAEDYEEAVRLSLAASGRPMPIPTWETMADIASMDVRLRYEPCFQERIR